MRTIFVCDYLASPELRREVHDGLQVVENWNSGNTVIINLIGATTTSTGLTVTAHLDTADYPTGIKISDKDVKNLITRDAWHGDWNYCVHPKARHAQTALT